MLWIAEELGLEFERIPLAMLDSVLSDGRHLLDGRFTVANLNVAGVLSATRLRLFAIDFSRFPRVVDWATRCHERPTSLAVRATVLG